MANRSRHPSRHRSTACEAAERLHVQVNWRRTSRRLSGDTLMGDFDYEVEYGDSDSDSAVKVVLL
jgi:hypothetical protein